MGRLELSKCQDKRRSGDGDRSPIVKGSRYGGPMIPLWLTLIALATAPTIAGECSAPNGCGVEAQVIPDFSLTDDNTASTTVGQTFTRDDFLGQVLVMYWAQAT